jgi:hypothetical protein
VYVKQSTERRLSIVFKSKGSSKEIEREEKLKEKRKI